MASKMTDEKLAKIIAATKADLALLDRRKEKAEAALEAYAAEKTELQARLTYHQTIAETRGLDENGDPVEDEDEEPATVSSAA